MFVRGVSFLRLRDGFGFSHLCYKFTLCVCVSSLVLAFNLCHKVFHVCVEFSLFSHFLYPFLGF